MRFDRVRPTNTLAAHRLLKWAGGLERRADLVERLFTAYLSEGRAVSDHDVLVELAGSVGLNREAARAVLETDAFSEEAREDQALAARLGIRGVPFFVFDHRHAASGAQPPEVLLSAMKQAVAEPADPSHT